MSFLDSVPIIGSYKKSSRAEDIVNQAKRAHRSANRELEAANKKSKELVEELFDFKIECATGLIETALTTLESCQKINKSETRLSKDVFESFKSKSMPSLEDYSITASDAISTGVKGTVAGTALSLGSLSAVSAYGAASTGTAITALSGAAAQNATLAWFGGGAISAGGAGIAGGTLVLGGIALAPLAIIGAFKYASHAEKKLTDAYDFDNKIDEIIVTIKAAIEIAASLDNHVQLYYSSLKKIADYTSEINEHLNSLIESNADESDIDFDKKALILFIKAIKRLLEIELFNNNQEPTEESIRVISHSKQISLKTTVTFLTDVTDENKKILPADVTYLSEIPPGEYSPNYFWLLDIYDEYENLPSKSTEDEDDKKLTFKELAILIFLALIGLVLSVIFSSSWVGLLSLWFIVNGPFMWLGGIIKNEKFTTFTGFIMLISTCLAGYIFYVLP